MNLPHVVPRCNSEGAAKDRTTSQISGPVQGPIRYPLTYRFTLNSLTLNSMTANYFCFELFNICDRAFSY